MIAIADRDGTDVGDLADLVLGEGFLAEESNGIEGGGRQADGTFPSDDRLLVPPAKVAIPPFPLVRVSSSDGNRLRRVGQPGAEAATG